MLPAKHLHMCGQLSVCCWGFAACIESFFFLEKNIYISTFGRFFFRIFLFCTRQQVQNHCYRFNYGQRTFPSPMQWTSLLLLCVKTACCMLQVYISTLLCSAHICTALSFTICPVIKTYLNMSRYEQIFAFCCKHISVCC